MRVGRPRKAREDRRTQVWATLPNREYDRLVALATAQGVTESALMGRIVSEWLATQGQAVPMRDIRDVRLDRLLFVIAQWRDKPKPKTGAGFTDVQAWVRSLMEMVTGDMGISAVEALDLLRYYNQRCDETGQEQQKIFGI